MWMCEKGLQLLQFVLDTYCTGMGLDSAYAMGPCVPHMFA